VNIIPFQSPDFSIRAVDIDGEDDKQNLQGVGFGPRGATVINESGMYAAILGSAKHEARRFKKWLTSYRARLIALANATHSRRVPRFVPTCPHVFLCVGDTQTRINKGCPRCPQCPQRKTQYLKKNLWGQGQHPRRGLFASFLNDNF